MGHRVRVLPYSTFKLNLSVTTPYNADFDGDEMNMHVPQSLETKAEIMEIMHVPKQIISPQSNRPVMGIVQDSLIGIKLFTHRDNFVKLDVLMNLIMWIEDFDFSEIPLPAVLKPEPLWTGKQIFSMFLPKKINLVRYTSDHSEKRNNPNNNYIHSKFLQNYNLFDTKVLIEDGELLMGIVCKKTVGNSSGGLIHVIFNEKGSTSTMYFLNHAQRIVNQWLLYNGFTVSISDTITVKTTNQKIKETMDEAKEKCKLTLLDAQKGHLQCQPGKSMLESFEAKVNAVLNEARDTAGRYVQGSLKPYNHLKNMVIAGSKGNITNISQIIACVGQQNVEGKRIPFYFNNRTLPHFTKDDYGPESRGFVENSYLSGLTAQEFFFHAMGGREGLIDTAVKTSETGYIQRRLVKALEDIMVKYDGTVRNSLASVIQFLYGEDGIAGELIEDQKLDLLLLDNTNMQKNFKFFDDDEIIMERYREKLQKSVEQEIIFDILYGEKLPLIKMELDKEYESLLRSRDEMREFMFKNGDDKQHFPVNIPRIIWNTKKIFKITPHTLSNIHPLHLIKKVEELKNELILVKGNDTLSREAQFNSTILINVIISYNLCCKRIILEEKLTMNALEYLLGEIKSRFMQAIIKPGEMVGSIAAQSIGEPATQMTLNTFHFAGVSSKNVTLGVPRLKEIINVAKKLKTPSMTVYLKKDFANSEAYAKQLQTKIEHTNMLHVTIRSEIYFDPYLNKTIIAEDEEMVDIDYKLKFNEEEENVGVLSRYSPWLLRIELDPNFLIDKNVRFFVFEIFSLNQLKIKYLLLDNSLTYFVSLYPINYNFLKQFNKLKINNSADGKPHIGNP